MTFQEMLYQEIADELNHDFRTVLQATATSVGVSVVPTIRADMYRLASNIEFSRVITSRKSLTVTLTDSGIICVR